MKNICENAGNNLIMVEEHSATKKNVFYLKSE